MAWRRRLSRPGLYIELILPPALLCYFAWAWRICTGPILAEYLTKLGWPTFALLYRYTGKLLLVAITTIFLRLYFLPARRAVPPPTPAEVTNLEVLFEVPWPKSGRGRLIGLDDEEVGDVLWNTCDKDLCQGGWKPPRARHCSECGRCRLGFDHHCLFVANCISAPVLPAFLALLLITPPAVLFLSIPLPLPVFAGMRLAWAATATNPRTQAYWDWGWSWVVPAGPAARYAVGLLIAWADLGPQEGVYGEFWRVDIGLLLFIGNLLALITAALAFWQVKHVLQGSLSHDILRERAFNKARAGVDQARSRGEEDPKSQEAMERFSSQKWFFVPLDHEVYAGAILPALPTERPYDLGWKANFDLMIARGRGWRWILPWNAVQRGMSAPKASAWPVNAAVKARLEAEAARLLEEEETRVSEREAMQLLE